MKQLDSEIKKLIEESKYKEKLLKILNNKKNIIEEINCCGTLAYILGKVDVFVKYASEIGLSEFLKLPVPVDIYPGYIPPRAGLEFIRMNCFEVLSNQLREGDIVLYMDRMYWCHAGIYIGNSGKKRIMFNKDGIESDFSFDNIDNYEPLEHSTERSFHRVKEQ